MIVEVKIDRLRLMSMVAALLLRVEPDAKGDLTKEECIKLAEIMVKFPLEIPGTAGEVLKVLLMEMSKESGL